MNLTLLAAVASLLLWIWLAFVWGVPHGYVHLLYALGMVLLTRRVLVGARGFKS